MGRKSGIRSFLRNAERIAKAAEQYRINEAKSIERELKREEAQLAREARQYEREQKEADQLAKLMHIEERNEKVNNLNDDLINTVESLSGILEHALRCDHTIDFASLKLDAKFECFKTPTELLTNPAPQKKIIEAPSGWRKLIPGAMKKYNDKLNVIEENFIKETEEYFRKEEKKAKELEIIRSEYSKRKAQSLKVIKRQNANIDQFKTDYFSGNLESIVTYCKMVLTRSDYPKNGFPKKFRLVYLPENKELVIEYCMPNITVIPTVLEYRYIKTRDAIDSKIRKSSEINKLYQNIISSITLRTLHELFDADQAHVLSSVLFNGILETIDPTSGHNIKITIVSVRAHKDDFLKLRLDKVDKVACLRGLGAQVSNGPEELQAIKPIIEFNMVDKRFIEQGDMLTDLESRPNLMDMTPSEFEVLVSNLFSQMGLDTKLTRGSKDGGVDAVAFDTRPILGGKVVIQAKRYKDTVGVSAVRDLYGTMMNEGANKGILVCTSKYGKDAYNFCKDKPIELIDGHGLLYLLREHAKVEARIHMA